MHLRDLMRRLDLLHVARNFDTRPWPEDRQGWGADHPWFAELVEELRPQQILEVGSWKGASAIRLATEAQRFEPYVAVVCIDTWLCSNAVLWTDPAYRSLYGRQHGYPTVYPQFLANICRAGLTDTIYPLPMTSIAASEVLAEAEVQVDLCYIDAGHGDYEVYGDLLHYWPLVRPGGALFGDDYHPSWPGVISAVGRFAKNRGLRVEIRQGKWLLRKPDEVA